MTVEMDAGAVIRCIDRNTRALYSLALFRRFTIWRRLRASTVMIRALECEVWVLRAQLALLRMGVDYRDDITAVHASPVAPEDGPSVSHGQGASRATPVGIGPTAEPTGVIN